MMQPSPLGFGPTTNPLPPWLGNGPVPGAGTGQTPNGTPAGDGVTRPWWANGTNANGVCPDGYGNNSGNAWQNGGNPWQLGGGGANTTGSLAGLLSGLVGALQQLLGSLTGAAGGNGLGAGGFGAGNGFGAGDNGFGSGLGFGTGDGFGSGLGFGGGASGGGNGIGGWGPPQWSPPGEFSPQQHVGDMNISSTGDPHIAESGTLVGPNGTTTQVSQKYDSMKSQGDLVDSPWIAGGYKVSTRVTQPNANGVTYNQSATVSANGGLDTVTMHRDGSYSITDAGNPVQLAKGKSITLSGGETVSANADGSLLVSATNGQGGSITTQLIGNGTEVNVATHAHDIALGGEVMRHTQNTPPA